jgi:hypothetical protein
MAADRSLLDHLPDILCLLRNVHTTANFISIPLIDPMVDHSIAQSKLRWSCCNVFYLSL